MSIPREGSRDTGKGILVSCAPDWCWVQVGTARVLTPFRLYAKQEDDANTAPTVRQQGKRSHTSGSIITVCHGDEAGNGLGVKSGTKESMCQPKTWSKTVRIEGKHAVRHNDEWWMNNRNTIGKLAYMEDVEIYEKPEGSKEYDASSIVNKGIQNEVNNAFGSQNAFGQGAQVADAATATMPGIGAGSGTSFPAIPAPGIGAGVTAGGILLDQLDYYKDNSALKDTAQRFGLDLSQGNQRSAARAYIWGTYNAGLSFWGVPHSGPLNENVSRGLMQYELVAPGTLDKARRGDADARKRLDDLVQGIIKTETDSVRVSEEKDKKKEDCRVGRYGSLHCPQGQQAHHIVPDYTLRYGNREEGMRGRNRIRYFPSFHDGAAICLTGMAADVTSEHGEAHGADSQIAKLGAGNAHYPAGTAPIGEIMKKAVAQTISVKPACEELIRADVNRAFRNVNPNQLGRTTADMWPAEGSPAYEALKSGESATIH